jgi:transposase InsO family protein
MSLSEACRRAGVTRKTGRKWVNRARLSGLENLAELSRAPKRVPGKTKASTESALLQLKELNGPWGAKKLVTLLAQQGIELPVRTADRILKRNGLVSPREPKQPLQRFERERCGALLQMDFKGLPKATPYALLTVLDDHCRFCHHFGPVPDKTGPSVMRALWEMFAVHGLPDEMLMDNGDCWGSPCAKGPTRFEAWLMRLGIKPIHGRPRHPQTQGKVERFHLTAKQEVEGGMIRSNADEIGEACAAFVDRYNWVRPHESLGQQVPGSLYQPWPRRRPDTPALHQIPEGAITRRVQPEGEFSFKGVRYNISSGLAGEHIVLQDGDHGIRILYAGFPIRYLHEL